MKKLILFSVAIFFIGANLHAQSSHEIQPLTIGDTLPDITIHHILNYKSSSAKISDFRGKVLILDFFATWCGSCIGALPELDSLQEQFGDKVQILVVDYEKPEKVRSFLQQNPIGKKVSLAFVTNDSILSEFFPHRMVPHEIWIDAQGKIQAITRSEYVTAKNLQDLITGNKLDLPLKKDQMDFDNNKFLFQNNNYFILSNLMYSTVFTGALDGVECGAGHTIDSINKYRRIYFLNQPILGLYISAIDPSILDAYMVRKRIILDVRDTSRYISKGKSWDFWYKNNAYCYELTVPLSTPQKRIDQLMLQDINRYLQLNGRIEKRLVNCWELISTSKDNNAFKTKGGESKIRYSKDNSMQMLYNKPISRFLYTLNNYSDKSIIINGTGYFGNVDLSINIKKIHDISSIRKALKPIGLDLRPVKKEIKMFVISEIGNQISKQKVATNRH